MAPAKSLALPLDLHAAVLPSDAQSEARRWQKGVHVL